MAGTPMERAWGGMPAMEAVAGRLRKAREASGASRAGEKAAELKDLSGGRLFADLAEGVPMGWQLQGFAESGAELGWGGMRS